MSAEKLKALAVYTACDISDALLRLEVPGAGFLADIVPIPIAPPTASPPPSAAEPPAGPSPSADATVASSSSRPLSRPSQKVIARASTVLFVPKSSGSFPNAAPPLTLLSQTLSAPAPNIPPGSAYSDLTAPGTIVVLSQPRDQVCAVLGGIMAARIARLGAEAIVVDGRVRDLPTLRTLGVPVFARGVSTIGAAAEAKAWAHNVPVAVGETTVEPGDVVMVDPEANAVVAVPAALLDRVIEMLPALVEADEKVMRDVQAGGDVAGAFLKHRGK